MSSRLRTCWVQVLTLGLGGCVSMAPAYHRPAMPVPKLINSDAREQTDLAPVTLDWRHIFVDPKLQRVMTLSLENNRDLRVALLNVEKAQAAYRIQAAELLPSISAGVDSTAERATTDGVSIVSRSTSANVGVSGWELDLFGQVRSLKNEALESWLSTQEAQRETRLSLLAQVAGQWLIVGSYEQRFALAQETLDSQEKSLQLTQRLHQAGASSGVDVAQIEGSVYSARADLESFRISLAQAKNELDLLAGIQVPKELLPNGDLGEAIVLSPLLSNVPSSALLSRPDIMGAEHDLKAANADIGAARAAFFPVISLTGSIGKATDQLSNLFTGPSRAWSFVSDVSVPIFSFGKVKSGVRSAEVQRDIAIAEYERAIQTAFQEAADALAERESIDAELQAQGAFVAASRKGFDLSRARYDSGLDSYLTVLDSQRSLYSAQQDLISMALEEQTNRVTIYKVFGGGADATER